MSSGTIFSRGHWRSDKQRKREQLRKNVAKGRAAELEAEVVYPLKGYRLKRDPHGQDYVAEKIDPLTGKVVKTVKIEVKEGRSRLSPLQKETRKKSKGKYEVYRTDAFPYNLL